MRNWTIILLAVLFLVLITTGCSGSNPFTPSFNSTGGNEPGISGQNSDTNPVQTHLWGYYEVYIDAESQSVEVVPAHSAAFTANVVNFINKASAGLGFKINGVKNGTGYTDIDIDITITHPFAGLAQYNGYDVRGIFMGDGSAELTTGGVIYPVGGTDQFMLADPDSVGVDNGAPDGYTRWFNFTEFSGGGMPLFQYTQGKAASPGFAGTATLCPYKYFADHLSKDEDLWTWMNDPSNQNPTGVFSSGQANTRNYYLRFPSGKGIKYGYAIIANWDGPEPEKHPANAPEAVAIRVVDSSDVYYIDGTQNGGNIILDISLWDWDAVLSAGSFNDYIIKVESSVLSSPYTFNSVDMTPTGGGENYSTFHVEIPADNVSGINGNEYWVIAQEKDETYGNDFSIPNLAQDDNLAAYFRYGLKVLDFSPNEPPVCDLVIDPSTPVPAEDFAPVAIKFNASGSYDPDGDAVTYEWDFDGDGIYDEPVDDSYSGNVTTPTHNYKANYNGSVYVRVSDPSGKKSVCNVAVQVTAHQSKNIPLIPGLQPYDLGVDPLNGDLWICYSDRGNYKYTLGGWYKNGAKQYSIGAASPYIIEFMDIAAGGYAMVMLKYTSFSPTTHNYTSTGVQLLGMGWGGADNRFRDCTNYPTTGTWGNDLMLYMGYYHTSMSLNITMVRGFRDPLYNNSDTNSYLTETYLYPPLEGIQKVYQEYLVAIDSDISGNSFWTLEAPDYYAAKFRLAPYYSTYWFTQVYDNSYFGTGSPSESDTCWTANVADMTRDKAGYFHVLDNIGGQAIIKVFTGSSTGGTSYGRYGDSSSIIGTPIAIDGDDFAGRIFVLHGNSANGYFLSIFKSSEFPY